MYKRQSLLGWFDGNVQDAMEAQWTGPGFPHIQPREAATANDMAVKLRVKTRSDIIRESGHDPDEVFKEAQEEEDKLRDLGLLGGMDDPDDMNDGDGDEDDPKDESEEDAEGNLKKSESKLAEREVRDRIRADHFSGMSHRQLARKYGVGKTPIAELVNGRSYKHDLR